MPKIFAAKFKGKCGKCAGAFEPGVTLICADETSLHNKWVHQTCHSTAVTVIAAPPVAPYTDHGSLQKDSDPDNSELCQEPAVSPTFPGKPSAKLIEEVASATSAGLADLFASLSATTHHSPPNVSFGFDPPAATQVNPFEDSNTEWKYPDEIFAVMADYPQQQQQQQPGYWATVSYANPCADIPDEMSSKMVAAMVIRDRRRIAETFVALSAACRELRLIWPIAPGEPVPGETYSTTRMKISRTMNSPNAAIKAAVMAVAAANPAITELDLAHLRAVADVRLPV